MNNLEKSFVVGRHFEDVNDLENGMDTTLKPLEEQSSETKDNINTLVLKVVENAKNKDKENILLIHSPRKRAFQSAEVIKNQGSRPDSTMI